MGLLYADIELANADDLALVARSILPADQARRATVRANVDSGAYMLCVNEEVESRPTRHPLPSDGRGPG